MAGGSVRLSDASIGALTATLTLLIVTLSVAVVVTRTFLRRRRQHSRHKSYDYGRTTCTSVKVGGGFHTPILGLVFAKSEPCYCMATRYYIESLLVIVNFFAGVLLAWEGFSLVPVKATAVRKRDAMTTTLTLLIVTLSVAVVVTRTLLRRRRQRTRHKSHDYGTQYIQCPNMSLLCLIISYNL